MTKERERCMIIEIIVITATFWYFTEIQSVILWWCYCLGWW